MGKPSKSRAADHYCGKCRNQFRPADIAGGQARHAKAVAAAPNVPAHHLLFCCTGCGGYSKMVDGKLHLLTVGEEFAFRLQFEEQMNALDAQRQTGKAGREGK